VFAWVLQTSLCELLKKLRPILEAKPKSTVFAAVRFPALDAS